LLPKERVLAAFEHRKTDKVPTYQAGFSSQAASYILGRPGYVGGGVQQWREAVALCPGCGQYFCRECITEHDDRVICAACLRKLAQAPPLRRRAFAGVARGCECLLGLVVVWFFFYLIGEGLLALPTSFHESTFAQLTVRSGWW
jgi:hypothetical protein